MPLAQNRILCIDLQGQVVKTLELAEVVEKEDYIGALLLREDCLFLTVSHTTAEEENGQKILDDTWRVLCLDREGKLQFSLTCPEGEGPSGFMALSTEQTAVLFSDKVVLLDTQAKAWGKNLSFASLSKDEKASYKVFPSDGDYLFLVQENDETLYGYDPATDTFDHLFSWSERDIVWKDGNRVYQQADGVILASDGDVLVRVIPCSADKEIL